MGQHGLACYGVSAATLVAPRTCPRLRNRTKTRFVAGLNGTSPDASTKTPKVAVALAEIVVSTVKSGGAKHAPVAGVVSHRVMTKGSVLSPVSAETSMSPSAPTFTTATENTPVLPPPPVLPGMCTMPSLLMVAANAITSGMGLEDPANKMKFNPITLSAGEPLSQK